jgi:hypothetical protein
MREADLEDLVVGDHVVDLAGLAVEEEAAAIKGLDQRIPGS